MARIGSYPIDAVIQDKDAWIGTQNTNRVTRQFTALGVAQYIDTKNVGLVFVGATNLLPGKKGLVPAPIAGQEGMYLKGDLGGGWTTIPVYTLDVPVGTTNVNLINTDGAGAVINSFITLTGGTYLTSVHTSGSQITFNHDDTVRTDPTKPTPTPAPGATLDLVSAVASNATGHVTGVTTSTVTWPADSDTTYTIDVPNATTSINLAGSDGTNDPIAFTTVAGNNGMTISRTDENTLNFNSKWQINNVNQDGYVPKGLASANKFWATDAAGNPGWKFQPSQDQTITSTGTTNASTGIILSQNGGTVIVKGDGSTINASSDNTTNVITLAAINRVNTTYTLPVAAGAANTAVINLTDNSAIVSSVTFNGTANKIAISETVGNNGDITIGMPDDVTVAGELTVSGTGQSSFGGQITIPQTPSADTDAASKKYVDDLVSGGLTFRGTFNAATGAILSGVSSGSQLYNCPGGAGTRIAVAVGDYYIVATAGGSFYCSGATLDIGDSIIATAAASADASVVTGWSVVQSDEGVASFTNANGTFVSAGTVNSNATGAVTMGTIDLSATGTKDGTTFLRGDNTWAVPAYVSYSAMTTSALGLGKIKYDNNSTPAANSQSTTTARTYGVTKNSSDQLVVNVPWLNSSDVNSVTASGAATALSGLTSTPNTGSVVIGLDINGRASLGSPAPDDELMIYDTSTAKNVKVLVSDLASYAGSAAPNQVTYWTSDNNIGGATGFTYAGGATGAITMGGALTTGGAVRINGTTTTGLVIASNPASSNGLKLYNDSANDNAYIYNHYDGNLEIGTNNATVLTMNGTSSTFAGNVLIGATSAAAGVLVVDGNSANNIWVVGRDSDGTGSLSFRNAADNAYNARLEAVNGELKFETNGTLALTIDANQNATFASAVWIPDYIYHVGDANSKFGFSGADTFVIQTSGTTALTIDSSSNATFAAPLTVNNGGGIAAYFNGNGSNYTQGAIALQSSNESTPDARGQGVFMWNQGTDTTWYTGTTYSNADRFIIGRATNASLNTEAARIDNAFVTVLNSGNVGMGEPSPTATLQVNGDIKIGSGGGSGTDSNNMSIQVSNSTYGDTANLGILVRNNGSNGQFAQIGFGYSETKCPVVIGSVITDGGGATKGDFIIGTRSTTTGTDAPTERMRVRSDGGIAIGAGNVGYSSQILSVKSGTADSVFYGESTDADCFASFRDNSSTANIEYGAIGNDHILRKDGTKYFVVNNVGDVYNYQSVNKANTYYGYDAGNYDGTGGSNNAFGYEALSDITTGTENIAIGRNAGHAITTGTKNICIGQQAGENITDGGSNTVIGVNAGDSLVSSTGNTIIGRLAYQAGDNASNVMVGIQAGYSNNGAENVFVGGYAGRSATINNTVAIGYSALYNCTGNANIAIGQQAMESTTSGSGNTAIGYQVLKDSTTGAANVAVGQQALGSSTTAGYSVAIGHEAGYGITTGDHNVVIGDRAGRILAAGAENTLIGTQTGYNLSGGNYNTCVGFKNLFAAAAGSFNTSIGFAALNQSTTSENAAFGAYAMHYSTSAQNGAAFGFKALFSQTTAEGNTAFGFQCMEAASTGAKNTAVGRSAGDSINTGSEHTVLGYSAGDEITTGDNCIAIGFAAGSGSSPRQMTTNSNEIVIGNNSIVGAYIRVAWTAGSDKRDKINFSNVPHGLDFVNKLKPTSYDLRKERDSDETIGERKYGFIAQEVLELEGDNPVIIDNSDENKLAIQDSNLIPILVNAIQELKAEIEILKNK